jgi:hypothetical protein
MGGLLRELDEWDTSIRNGARWPALGFSALARR